MEVLWWLFGGVVLGVVLGVLLVIGLVVWSLPPGGPRFRP